MVRKRAFHLIFSAVLLICSLSVNAEAVSAIDGFDPGANGNVYAMALQPDGKLIVGGAFTTLAGQARSNIGRLNADGSIDDTFNPGADDPEGPVVFAVAVQDDGKIIVAGWFTTLGGQPRNCIGRLNSNGTIDETFNPGADGTINALALQADGKILAGGQFTVLGSQPRSKIGRLNADGTIDDTFDPGADATVNALVVQPDGKILVGGYFTTLGGFGRNRLGRLQSSGSLDTAFSDGANSVVYTLAVQADGKIVVGGGFTFLGGEPRNYIGRLESSGSPDMLFDPGAGSPVYALAVQADGKILVGGVFTTLGGQPRSRIGRLNPEGDLDNTFNPGAGSTVRVLLQQPDGKILVGGDFTTLAGQARSRIGRLYTDGSLDATLNPGADNAVYTMALQPDGKIIVGGWFTSLGGWPRNYVGRLNPDGSLDDTFNPGSGPYVTAVAVQPDGKILVGGIFSTLANSTRNYLGRLYSDGTLDDTFDPGIDPAAGNYVSAIVVQPDGKIVVGGQFATINGESRSNIARLNPGGSLDDTFNPGANAYVTSLALQTDGKIVVGGGFLQLGGTTGRWRLGRLESNGTLDLSFTARTGSVVSSVSVQADGKILVGGAFSNVSNVPRLRIARLNSDGSLDLDFNPGANGAVYSLVPQSDGKVLVGGVFTLLAGETRNYIGRLNSDGSLDDTFDPGADNDVRALAVQSDGKVLAGGSFSTLGGQSRANMGRLSNNEASQQRLEADISGTMIGWSHGGSFPEVGRATFESSDDGTAWTSLGDGEATAGGWRITGLSLPTETPFYIRGRGYATGGMQNGSGSLFEAVRSAYLPLDATPDAFSFDPKLDVALSSWIESDPVTVTGINQTAAISIDASGEYSVSTDGGGSWSSYSTSTPSTVNFNDQVKARVMSSGSPDTTTSTMLTIGGIEGTFSVTTYEPSYTLTVHRVGSGSVDVSTGSLSWTGDTGTATYAYNTPVEITVTPDSLFIFSAWSDDCTGSGSCNVTMNAPRTVTATFVSKTNFTASPMSGGAPLIVAFTDTSTNTPTTAWAWTFGDGGTSTEQNPTHWFSAPGDYNVTLIATGGGISPTVTKTISVTACSAGPVRKVFDYSTIQLAYDATGSNDVRMQAREFSEVLSLADDTKIITLKGGYDCIFSTNPSYTTVSGSVTISGGTVTLENIIIK